MNRSHALFFVSIVLVLVAITNGISLCKENYKLGKLTESHEIRSAAIFYCNVFGTSADESAISELQEEMDSKLRNSFVKVAYFRAIDVKSSDYIGFVEVYEDNSSPRRPVVQSLCVSPTMRRKGLGTDLLHACEEEALSWGYSSIFLNIEDDNDVAKKFYEILGYSTVLGKIMDITNMGSNYDSYTVYLHTGSNAFGSEMMSKLILK